MLSNRYLEITLNVPENYIEKMTGKIMERFHFIVVNENLNVGVAFPQYNFNESSSTGFIIRMFGDLQSLKKIWNDHVISEEENKTDITIELLTVPDSYKKVKYLRDRTVDNFRNKENDRKKHPNKFPIIRMNSHSTSQFFLIHLKKIVVDFENNDFKFNSYGLSNKIEESWVPDF